MSSSTNTKIVFATGCFDLFHVGHVKFLEQAKALGTKLVVGVQTDEWMRESKGEEPIYPLEHRLHMVSSLKCVDVAFPISGPVDEKAVVLLGATIRAVGPNYSYLPYHDSVRKKMESVGIEYIIIPRTPNISTTEIKEWCYGQINNRKDLLARLDNLRHVVSIGKKSPTR
jgi:cytidyltransferase-like protein